ncbi:MAG: alpha/beta hydrolase [Chitinivibrionales bacterium]|nr:alpha/beta hydrolase [Chitinivibrionales bacterium]
MIYEHPRAQIYYEVIGSGVPIVNIHGFYTDHRIMKGFMEPLFADQERFQRIYFDLPHMGKTKADKEIDSTDSIFRLCCDFGPGRSQSAAQTGKTLLRAGQGLAGAGGN